MKSLKLITVAAASLALAGIGHAQTADAGNKAALWLGSWRLDPTKSHLTGYTVTFSQAAPGKYHFEDGSTGSFDFGTDGKEYPTAYGRTTVWTPVSDHAWDSVTKLNGKVLYKAHREISADEKTLTVTGTGTNPDGSPINETMVYARMSGQHGLVGTWRDVKISEGGSPDGFVISAAASGALRMEIPQWQSSLETRLDGSEVPIKGPEVPAGMTYTGKLEAPNKISFVLKFNGKPDMYGEDTMGADGRSYTDVTWNPGRENEKTTGVYVKQ